MGYSEQGVFITGGLHVRRLNWGFPNPSRTFTANNAAFSFSQSFFASENWPQKLFQPVLSDFMGFFYVHFTDIPSCRLKKRDFRLYNNEGKSIGFPAAKNISSLMESSDSESTFTQGENDMILQKCSKCGAILESPGSLIGQEDYCPLCKQRFIVQPARKSRLKLGGMIAAGVVFLVILLAVAFFMGKASTDNVPKYAATQKSADPLDIAKETPKPANPLDIAKETRKEIVIQEANPRVTIIQAVSEKAPTQKIAAQPNIVDTRAKEAIIGVIRHSCGHAFNSSAARRL